MNSIIINNTGPEQGVFYVDYATHTTPKSWIMIYGWCPECGGVVTSHQETVLYGPKCFHRECYESSLVQILKQLEAQL